MTSRTIRLLLVVAIFLIYFATRAASYDISGPRSRHRRWNIWPWVLQPASFVIPGGEGDGEGWGEWGPVSPCSRTCGGGVASQKRICQRAGEGDTHCTGGDTKYHSCETQDCPEGSIDFRAQQCSELNDKDFKGSLYEWIPFTEVKNPCELNCKPRGGHFYYRHVDKVTDGTKCNADSFDVCVDGQCQPVGCDMMLGSDAREDQCRVCDGDGSTCHTTSGLFNQPDLTKGYNDILLIPKGSTNILIEEIAPSNNSLVLRSMNGTYYLNGNYRIDFPKSVMIAGALWHYEREHLALSSPDKLRCLGPTKEPLYLSMFLQDDKVGCNYKFSVPNDMVPPTDQLYSWMHEDFTTCNLTCGGGYQLRNVTCRSTDELEAVDDALCDEGLKPASAQPCNTQPCAARWEEGPWGNCSQRCGEGGVQARNVTCERVIANGLSSLVNEHECFEALGPKPKLFQKCNEDIPCPKWFVEPWKKCNSCLSTHMHRQVMCVTNSTLTQVVDDSFCSYHNKPPTQQPCGTDRPTCEVMWYATQWGKCSVECRHGIQERKVFCGMVVDSAVVEVNESSCDPALKYHDSKPCSVPLDQCPSQYIRAWPQDTSPSMGTSFSGSTPIVYAEAESSLTTDGSESCSGFAPGCQKPRSCHETVYGCCPDGVSPSQGDDLLGCPPETPCAETLYGCCPDNKTAAVGNDHEGCPDSTPPCKYSNFGCCADNKTVALGPHLEGCPRKAACHQPMDSGKCHNYTVAWYYDTTYGGCTKFWYTGCEGNENRFSTKKICEDVCVEPAPKDACKLPAVKGACDGDSQRWYYDSEREQCTQFRYGGCLGNANNFDTRELCQAQCKPDTPTTT